MIASVWGWIRRRTAESVLAGVHDALEQLGDGEQDDGRALAQLRARVTALPAPEEPEETAGRKRGGR